MDHSWVSLQDFLKIRFHLSFNRRNAPGFFSSMCAFSVTHKILLQFCCEKKSLNMTTFFLFPEVSLCIL